VARESNKETADEFEAGISPHTRMFLRVQIALFLGGFSTFALLYSPQPLLPLFSASFDISPARASLLISTATGVMSVMLIVISIISDRFGRRIVMLASLLVASLLMIACALTDDFFHLFLFRTLQGVALAGLPAVAMAYLSEEIEFSGLGYAMGFYISGNAMGGMSGRFISAWVAEHSSWQMAFVALGVLSLIMLIGFWKLLPRSRRFRQSPLRLALMFDGMRTHLRDSYMPWLFILAFLICGSFISIYNFIGFRLVNPPFLLSTGQIGSIFLIYIIGIFSSTWTGKIADRLGLARVLWIVVAVTLLGVLLTLASSLWVIIFGAAVATFGFFGSHAVASSWVGRRAKRARGLASALYLWAYYFGSSVIGTFSGTLWNIGGWSAIVLCLALCLGICLAIALRLLALERRRG
jgi:YNFM family putative membrane transporter